MFKTFRDKPPCYGETCNAVRKSRTTIIRVGVWRSCIHVPRAVVKLTTNPRGRLCRRTHATKLFSHVFAFRSVTRTSDRSDDLTRCSVDYEYLSIFFFFFPIGFLNGTEKGSSNRPFRTDVPFRYLRSEKFRQSSDVQYTCIYIRILTVFGKSSVITFVLKCVKFGKTTTSNLICKPFSNNKIITRL